MPDTEDAERIHAELLAIGEAIQERNAKIIEGRKAGLTYYRMAKALQMSEQAVRSVVLKSQEAQS